jgi:predicted CxxxxCH...CXXCH cytochrome family protein
LAARLSSLTSKGKTALATSLLASVIATFGYQAARAYPEGAPWGAADPNAKENCTTCHFDNVAVQDSSALSVKGLPEKLVPDTTFELIVTFDNAEGVAAGFQLIAWSDSMDAGTFSSETDNTETLGSAIRSISPVVKEGSVVWAVRWHTPAAIEKSITIYVAATAANHDQSPLGDRVHFRSYTYTGGVPLAPD